MVLRDAAWHNLHKTSSENAQWAIVVRVCKMEVLTEENINPAFNRVKYDIRGWLEDRAHEIRQELARVSVTLISTRWEREITQRIKLHEFLWCKWGRVCSMSVTAVGQSFAWSFATDVIPACWTNINSGPEPRRSESIHRQSIDIYL